jgi:hypothetical protein
MGSGTINDHRKTFKFGGFSLIALLALTVAAGGTFYIAQNPGNGAPQSPSALAAEGGHSSPSAAVSGFFGNAFLNNWTKACSYEPPSEQSTCKADSIGTPPESGSLAIGKAIVEGRDALVPITGRACRYGACRTFQGNGLPASATFRTVYTEALNPPDSSWNLAPCQEVGNKWYMNGSNP